MGIIIILISGMFFTFSSYFGKVFLTWGYKYVDSATGAIIGYMLLGERINLRIIIGIILISFELNFLYGKILAYYNERSKKMKRLSERLSKIKVDKVLDIATRDGTFIKQLVENLDGYGEIIGIDISDEGFSKAKTKFAENNKIKFEVMDAYHTDFPDNYFDLVCISNSLHHIEKIPALLKEIKRIKSEKGLVLISEIPSDGQFGSSLTHALIHNLDCVIDTYSGNYHHKTYSHKQIYEFVSEAGLTIIEDFDDVEVNKSKNISIKSRVDKAMVKVNNYKDEEYYMQLHNLAMEIQDNYNNHGANTAAQYIVFAN